MSGLAEFVVRGVTMEGREFEPPDWAERLYAKVAGSGGRIAYASYIRVDTIEGVKSLVVRSALLEADPRAFNTIKQYVADNHLVVRAGRGVVNAEGSGSHRVLDKERRDPKRNDW